MSLNNFFRINLPYGLERNHSGEWTAFNREYVPLGISDDRDVNKDSLNQLPLFTKYRGLTDSLIMKLSIDESFNRDDSGAIVKFWLYNDATNPTMGRTKAERDMLFDQYFRRLRILSELEKA